MSTHQFLHRLQYHTQLQHNHTHVYQHVENSAQLHNVPAKCIITRREKIHNQLWQELSTSSLYN